MKVFKSKTKSQKKTKAPFELKALGPRPEGCWTLFLGNLSYNIDEEKVREHFKDCGEISSVRWVEKDGEFNGCGFVEFADETSLDAAAKLQGTVLLGRTLTIDYAPDR